MNFEQWVDIEPMAAPRHRARRIGKGIAFYHESRYTKWLDQCRGLYEGPMFEGAVDLQATFHIPRGKTVKRPAPLIKPDIDNYLKALMDALTGAAYKDDGQVLGVSASKRYADNEPPGIWISLQ